MIADKLILEIGTPIVAYLEICNPRLSQDVHELMMGGPKGRSSQEGLALYRAILQMVNGVLHLSGENSNVIDLKANG